MGKDQDTADRPPERRSEIRNEAEQYYSVQFTTKSLSSFYQFKIWNISTSGMCILVKEDSEVLNHISVGDQLEMTYFKADSLGGSDTLKTRIKHITKNEAGRFQGHFLVGLSIHE
jgi:hypothetical protein